MKESLYSVGRAGIAGIAIATAGSCTSESEYIQGTVLDMRREAEEHRIETRTELLSDCPVGTTHLSNSCLPKPYLVTVDIWDTADYILTLKGKDGKVFETYVWPRIYRNTFEGDSVRIDPLYGSLTDDSNVETVIGKKPVPKE